MNEIVESGMVHKFYPVFPFNQHDANFMAKYINSNKRTTKTLSILAVGISQIVLATGTLKKLAVSLPSPIFTSGKKKKTPKYKYTTQQKAKETIKWQNLRQ